MDEGEPIDLKVCIPSRKRAGTILQHTLKFIPDALVTVNESEVQDYLDAGVPREQLIPHPESTTLSYIRNFILDNVDADFVVMVDDDLTHVRTFIGWEAKLVWDPVEVRELLEQTAVCARDAGAFYFGYTQDYNASHGCPTIEPFKMTGWVAAVVGFVRGHGLRFQDGGHPGIDMSLQNLLKHRIIWKDERVCWVTLRYQNSGGVAATRTMSRLQDSDTTLKSRWGKYVTIGTAPKRMRTDGSSSIGRGTVATRVDVPRRRAGLLD